MEGITSPPPAQARLSASSFNPLLISMLGIAVTSIAIIVYHFILVRYCIRRYGSTTNTAPQSTTSPQSSIGVEEKVLETIPILAFSVVKRGTDQEECVVCLGEFDDEDMVRVLPNCKHAFHVPCIDQWLAAHVSCPLCRSPILGQINAEVESLDPNISDRGESSATTNVNRESPLRREQSFSLLRHCASMMLPTPAEPMERRSWSRLKRSLSMDQYSFVVINLHMVNCTSSSSSSSAGVLTRSGSYCTRSLSHFDCVSAKWFRSISRLPVGKRSNGAILPY